jgi:hypothetical protein
MKINRFVANEKGILTLDFIFASVIVFAFSAILFSFAITLSVAEVIQYISFSTARNYSLAHLNETKQRERAQLKFDQLSSHPAIQPMLNSGWFKISPAIISDFNSEFNASSSDDSAIFIGARIPMSAPILYKRIPMLGTTSSDSEGFTANVQSFLAREPNFNECEAFTKERANAFRSLGYATLDPSAVALIMDNGC